MQHERVKRMIFVIILAYLRQSAQERHGTDSCRAYGKGS